MMLRRALRIVPVVLACAVLPAQAGLFDDEEARRQIVGLRKELQASIDALAKRLDGTSQNQLEFANQVEALRADVARLTGQIEVLHNSLETVQKRQQDFYVDLDNRLRKLESAASTAVAAPAEPKADPQAEMRDYETALRHFRESRFKEAQTAFEEFIEHYTRSTLLPNAHYWLGSSLYQQKLYDQAAIAFHHVATTWPSDAKAPDALLAQSNALTGAKDAKGAVRVLETLVEKYPSSPAAESARTRLKTLAPPPPPPPAQKKR